MFNVTVFSRYISRDMFRGGSNICNAYTTYFSVYMYLHVMLWPHLWAAPYSDHVITAITVLRTVNKCHIYYVDFVSFCVWNIIVMDKKNCKYIFKPHLIHVLFVFGLSVFVILFITQ